AGGVIEKRHQGVTRFAEALEIVVALREPQRDELLVVASRDARQRHVRVACVRISAGTKQTLGATEVQLEAVGREQRRLLEALDLASGQLRLGAQGELVIDAAIRAKRLRGVAA